MKILRIAIVVLTVTLAGVATGRAQGLSGTLRSTGGGSVPVANMRGRVAVLFFGGIADPQSPDELPELQRLAKRYQGRSVEVYWVSVDPAATTDTELVSYAAKYGYTGAILRDGGDVLRSAVTGRKPQLPTIVVLDQNGAVAGKPLSGFDRDVDMVTGLAAVIDPLLN